MFNFSRVAGFLILMSIMSACTLPRSAPLQSEILYEQNAEDPTFQVVTVTRDSMSYLSTWPVTGWKGHYHWFSSDRQPDSSVIQTGDIVNIVLWDNEDNSLLSNEESKQSIIPPMEVSSSGKIFIPYVGDIAVRGLTAPEARRRVESSLSEIAGSAQVQLSVEGGRNNSVDMVGGVAAPGRYPLDSRDTRIMTLLAQSGGIKDTLRHPLVRLQRGGHVYETRAKDLLADAGRNVRVRGGDQIAVVEDDRKFNVIGAAKTERVVYFESENMSLMEALSQMGGLSDARANPKGVLILREYDASQIAPGTTGPDMQQVVFTINLTTADGLFAARKFQVHPNDTVLPTESFVNSVRTVLSLLGNVVGFSSTVGNL